LAANDNQIKELAKLYWYTSEIGLIKENKEKKVYGGAILSSVSETRNVMSSNP
jgi:phenylalanine-4-hydroxylase